MSFVEQPTRKRLGDIVMTSRGYLRRTRKGFVPWTPEERKNNRLAIARALEDEPCPYCEGRGTVPPEGNEPYWDRERVLCVECDGTGEA